MPNEEISEVGNEQPSDRRIVQDTPQGKWYFRTNTKFQVTRARFSMFHLCKSFDPGLACKWTVADFMKLIGICPDGKEKQDRIGKAQIRTELPVYS